MELAINVNFANGSRILWSEGEKADLIGHHYPVLHASHIEFRTNVETHCETDMHYLERKPKEAIAKGEVVEPIDIWCNFYGMYLRCKYRDLLYDIKTSKVLILRKEVEI